MARIHQLTIAAALLIPSIAFIPDSARAADTPPSADCETVQSCIDAGVQSSILGCFAATPTCTQKNHDNFAVSASTLAARAVATKKCDTKTFTKRGACNVCFAAAKEPLRDRFYGKLFHGLLAQTVKEVEQLRRAKCLTIPK